MERYERIQLFEDKLIQDECPVILEKGALLRDNKYNKNILQLKFRNIGLKRVKAVYISVNCFDIEKQLLETVEKKYLDLDVGYETFGDKSPIELNNELSRIYEYFIQKIIFEDTSVYEYYRNMRVLKEPDSINSFKELKEQFVMEVKNVNSSVICRVKPIENESIWYCTCGALNAVESSKCRECDFSKEKLFELTDEAFLRERREDYLIQLEIDRKKKLEDKKERQRKVKKIALSIVSLSVVLILIYGIITMLIIPSGKYSSALKEIEKGNYEAGCQILTELGNYKDSPERIMEATYLYAKELIDEGIKKDAMRQLEKISGYKDADDLYKKCAYEIAENCRRLGEYEDAIEYYLKADDYEDAQEKLLDAKYQYCRKGSIKDMTVRKYLEELINIDYQGAQSLYNKMNSSQLR